MDRLEALSYGDGLTENGYVARKTLFARFLFGGSRGGVSVAMLVVLPTVFLAGKKGSAGHAAEYGCGPRQFWETSFKTLRLF